jgi:hypothetical protein
MKEIYMNSLGGELLFGKEQLGNQVDNFVPVPCNSRIFLIISAKSFNSYALAIRGDIIIGALQRGAFHQLSKVAGIVLTAGLCQDEL